MWGAAPRPGRGRALRARRTENRERRTERPCGATDKAAVQSGDSRKNQTSKLPNFRLLLHPQARLRRAQWRCNGGTGDAGDAGDAGAPASGRRSGRRGVGRSPTMKPSFQTSKLPSFQTKSPRPGRSGAFVAWGRIIRRRGFPQGPRRGRRRGPCRPIRGRTFRWRRRGGSRAW